MGGESDVYFRVELAFFDGGTMHVTFLRPDGSTALDAERPTPLQGYGATWADFHERLNLGQTGGWRLRLATDGRTLVDAPFDVVAGSPRNRPPNAVSVDVQAGVVGQCTVRTSLITEDPDYDIVRYRYRWFVGKKRVRSITSAALSDVLRRDRLRPGAALRCEVTPSDGKLFAPAASASARVS